MYKLFMYFIDRYLLNSLCEEVKRRMRIKGYRIEYEIVKNRNTYTIYFTYVRHSGTKMIVDHKEIELPNSIIPFLSEEQIQDYMNLILEDEVEEKLSKIRNEKEDSDE